MTTKTKAKTAVTSATKLAFQKARPGKGTKTEFLALVPRKGTVTVAKLKALAAEKLELSAEKAEKWIKDFVQYGRVKVV